MSIEQLLNEIAKLYGTDILNAVHGSEDDEDYQRKMHLIRNKEISVKTKRGQSLKVVELRKNPGSGALEIRVERED